MQTLSPALRIGVLRGGPSAEYDTSLKTGADVIKHLSDTHKPTDIFISKDGKWHISGVERSPERILKNVDVVFNALHGNYGEDGGVQEILNHHGIPYTGSDRYASAMAMNRWITKEKAFLAGIKTPVAIIVRRTDSLIKKAKEIFESIPHPLVVKPTAGGSYVKYHIVKSFEELLSALEDVLSSADSAVVEEYISGKSASCGVINNFRGQKDYVLPPTEISEGAISCPGNFSEKEKKEIEKVALLIHNKLGLKCYSDSDFIVSPRRGVYLLEVNTTPRLHQKSFLPKSLSAVGVEIKEFLHHLLHTAIFKTGIMP